MLRGYTDNFRFEANMKSVISKDQKLFKPIRFQMYFADLFRLVRIRNSLQQVMNENTPTGNKFVISYQCLVTPDSEGPCSGDEQTSTWKCEGGKAVYMKTGEPCSQASQCETGSCNAQQVCEDVKADGEPCDYNHECQSKFCGTLQPKCNGKATPIQTSISKTCQPAASLKLNDECEADINCGQHNGV